jgi:hypothetical protein
MGTILAGAISFISVGFIIYFIGKFVLDLVRSEKKHNS